MRWFVFMIFLVMALGVYLLIRHAEIDLTNITTQVETNSQSFDKKSDHILFEELTIPYLRNREYYSEFKERVEYQNKQSYKSYLTSYVSDGLKINGLITIPKGDEPFGGWPAIVFVHGYIPPTLYRTNEKYIEYVDYLAKNGFVVFKIDLRGHGQSDGEAGGAYYSSDYVIDVLNAYRALQNTDEIDKNKVFLWGHSMAGNVLFRVAAVEGNIPKIVIWAGAVYSYSDFTKYGISDNSYRPAGMTQNRQRKRQQIFDTYGQFNSESDFWRKVSAVNYLDDVNTQFQVHHAVDDNVVNIGYSRDLEKILLDSNKYVEYFEYKTGGHNINGTSFTDAMRRTVDFLRR